jgi:hypothetical protein
MTLIVISTFMNLAEAQIVAGALESGGLHPLVMDQVYGSVNWTGQFGLQGFRLAVPKEEAADAIVYFRSLPAIEPRPMPESKSVAEFAGAHWWRALSMALLPFGLGWLPVGFRYRGAEGRAREAAFGFVITSLVVIGPLGLLMLALSTDTLPQMLAVAAIVTIAALLKRSAA